MKKLFEKHTPVRLAGTVISKKACAEVWFVLEYVRCECADFLVNLEVEGGYFVLFGFRLSFCLACGRFTHFGTKYEVCWLCQEAFE
jgi:hypothetical protein